jgi:hypothetical protein
MCLLRYLSGEIDYLKGQVARMDTSLAYFTIIELQRGDLIQHR